MLHSLLTAAALSLAPAGADPAAALDDEHGKLPWFEGTWEELLQEAEAKEKIVFLDFWAEW